MTIGSELEPQPAMDQCPRSPNPMAGSRSHLQLKACSYLQCLSSKVHVMYVCTYMQVSQWGQLLVAVAEGWDLIQARRRYFSGN